MGTDQTRIRERARRNRKEKFTSLYHHVTDLENLRASWKEIERAAAPGIDGITRDEYGQNLEENLRGLQERLKQMTYRPKPVKRVYIPKAGSKKKRPLGIPCVEDKIVQSAVARVLEQIYEADFERSSYGYRPGRTQHQALDELGRTIQQKKINWVAEADIKGFFDHVKIEWLERMLEERIGDPRMLRLIKRMLKAGVMEDGLARASEEGVVQGSPLSALLSNIYLHYAMDLWFERRFRKQCRGEVYYIRYADDYLACFQTRREAEAFLREMRERLEKFGLEVEESKTKLIQFGRYAEQNAEARGVKPEQFDFLGFTHYCGKTRYGAFKVKRKTSKKKYRAKLKEAKEWLRKERNRHKSGELLKRAKLKLVGHLNYYAVTDNLPMCQDFSYQYTRIVFKWLNRRSQKRSYTWERFRDALNWVGWPQVKRRHHLDPFRKKPALNDC